MKFVTFTDMKHELLPATNQTLGRFSARLQSSRPSGSGASSRSRDATHTARDTKDLLD
jgi:hypothetical protein